MKIANINTYLKGLDKGVEDKLFFLYKIDPEEYDTVIEFGSGSGIVLYTAAKAFDSYVDLIGIENNIDLLVISRNRALEKDNVRFYDSIDKLNLRKQKDKKTLLILSSVLHELDLDGIITVNRLIESSDTVVIRDMQSPKNLDLGDLSNNQINKMLNKIPMYMIEDFHERFGMIFDDKRNLHQFLLRYTYVDNWKSELKENYFRGADLIEENEVRLEDGFYIFYSEEFMLPHQVKQIKEKFGYTLDEPTHFKRIYHRKEEY